MYFNIWTLSRVSQLSGFYCPTNTYFIIYLQYHLLFLHTKNEFLNHQFCVVKHFLHDSKSQSAILYHFAQALSLTIFRSSHSLYASHLNLKRNLPHLVGGYVFFCLEKQLSLTPNSNKPQKRNRFIYIMWYFKIFDFRFSYGNALL